MTNSQLKKLVRQIRYKPGWKVRLDDSGDIEVIANVPDAYHPRRKPIDPPHAYVISTTLRWKRRPIDVIELIADAIQRLESHEFGEWFKYRGKRIYDPHK